MGKDNELGDALSLYDAYQGEGSRHWRSKTCFQRMEQLSLVNETRAVQQLDPVLTKEVGIQIIPGT